MRSYFDSQNLVLDRYVPQRQRSGNVKVDIEYFFLVDMRVAQL